MNIYIMGACNERSAAFETYARASGASVQRIEPEGRAVPDQTIEMGGIVVFDDGHQPITDWVSRIRENTRYLCLPTIAVSARVGRELHARLYAAGAASICELEASHEQILNEIRARCDIKPILEDLRQRLLEPFTNSTQMTLREMANTEISVLSVYQKTNYKMFGDISAVIGLKAHAEGALVMSFPEATAQALSKRVLAGFTETLDADMVSDCIGELANVVAGQAKGLLAGSPFEFALATPTIVSGTAHEIRHKPGMPCLVAAFSSDVGDFALQLCFGLGG